MSHARAGSGSGSGCGGSRREFLRTGAAAGVAAAVSGGMGGSAFGGALAGQEGPVPRVTLGKTGAKVTKLGMGTSWAFAPSFVQAAIASGVRYIDTSETYENTVAEKYIGEVIERTKMRDQLFLVSKNAEFRKAAGDGAAKVIEERLDASLDRLRTDYVDAYYLHGLTGERMNILRDPGVRKAFEDLKRRGKIRFAGLSCHDALLPEILELAAEVGWIDQVMLQYNFREVDHDKLQRAIDKASKANLGLIAMKTQKGASSFADRVAKFTEKGVKREVAAIKAVWADERMHVVVSEMTNRSDLRENIAASREELTPKEARLLEDHRRATARMYCHGCGHLCESSGCGVPVATVLRYLRYYEAYGKRGQARALYQALPEVSRRVADARLDEAEAACPHGLPVAELVRKADTLLS